MTIQPQYRALYTALMYYKQILTRIDGIRLIYQSVRTPENFQLALQTLQREALNLQAYIDNSDD